MRVIGLFNNLRRFLHLAAKKGNQVAHVLQSEKTAGWLRAFLNQLISGLYDPSRPVLILTGFCRGLPSTVFNRARAPAS